MAGLEIVVRPVVFPDTRPTPARVLPPLDEPGKGFCEIKGMGGKHVDLTYSHSISMSKSRTVEVERCSQLVRVYQKQKDGKINKNNFVDVEVANKIKSRDGKGPRGGDDGKPLVDGVEKDTKPIAPVRIAHYKKAKEADNIEELEPHVCIDNPDDPDRGAEE